MAVEPLTFWMLKRVVNESAKQVFKIVGMMTVLPPSLAVNPLETGRTLMMGSLATCTMVAMSGCEEVTTAPPVHVLERALTDETASEALA